MRYGLLVSGVLLALFPASLPGSAAPSQKEVCVERMMANISPAGTVPGTVVAATSRQSPNYWFHWVRDSSLVMDQVVRLWAESPEAAKPRYLKAIRDFVALTRMEQQAPGAEGLGEPRYRVEGPADTIPWSRPQHDGPALRALTLMRFLAAYAGEPSTDESSALRAGATEAIRADLDHVLISWRLPCFDLWEELRGLHFYTQSVQQAALRDGAAFFRALGDAAYAERLGSESGLARTELEKYWDPSKGIVGASRELERRPENPDYKDENLDVSVILAALHGRSELTDDHLLATARALEAAFAQAYSINRGSPAIAIGRFTDDVYYGGNPWYVTTAAFAEFHYRLARAIVAEGGITVTELNLAFLGSAPGTPEALKPGERLDAMSPRGQALIEALRRKGDGFIGVVLAHAGSQGELSEQFDRDAGVPVSAENLTWSYAAVFSALRAGD
jgi:glucoamylase